MSVLVKIKQLIYNERGIALIMVLLIMTVLSILGMAMFALSLNNKKTVDVERKYESAYHIAEAGATETYSKINGIAIILHKDHYYREKPEKGDFYKDLESKIAGSSSSSDFKEAYGEKPKAEIKVEGSNGNYTITSTGTIENQTRTVVKPFKVNWNTSSEDNSTGFSKKTAIIVKSTITLSGSSEINGDIWVGNSVPNIKDKNINGSIYSLLETNQFIPEFPSFPKNPSQVNLDDLIVNTNKEIKLSNEITFFDQLKVEGETLTFNTGKSDDLNQSSKADKKIVINDLNLLKDGMINITGDGKLKIYIKDTFNMENKTELNALGKSENLEIYWKGSGTLNLKNNHQKISGLLYVENGTVDLQGSIITGTIIANKVNANGNVTVNHGSKWPFKNNNSSNGIVSSGPVREK